MAPRLLSAALLATLTLGGPWVPARAQPPAPPADDCDVDVFGEQLCASIEALGIVVASVCEEASLPVCTLADPDVSDPAAMTAFEASWVARALRLQHHLDDAVPLAQALVPHTHNSYNSTAYPLALSNLDPNQRYTVTDQLRMGMRGIELDLHWVNGAVVLCHGESVELAPDLTVHVGCSLDRPLADGLAELRAWLTAPGNTDEFVVLYLENQLEDDPAAHDQAAAVIEREIGGLVIRPPAGQPCAPMPLDETQTDLSAGGGRVLIVGNCGPAGWGTWVHERGDRWDERSNRDGYPSFPACAAEREALAYDDNWIRVYEDSTWLSTTAGAGSTITVEEVRAMVRCAVDMVGFDRLTPTDPRLEALIWSWAPDEPSGSPGLECAVRGTDGRFRAAACDEERAFTCRADDGSWLVTDETGPWTDGEAACATVGATFAVPPNGWENERLASTLTGADPRRAEPWLAYASIDGGWTVGPAAGAMATGSTLTPAEERRRSLPATGTAVPLGLAGLLVGVATLARLVRYGT